jgi:cell division protein FtsN
MNFLNLIAVGWWFIAIVAAIILAWVIVLFRKTDINKVKYPQTKLKESLPVVEDHELHFSGE